MHSLNKHKIAWLVLLGTLSILGIILIKETTGHGAGLRPDSFTYLSAAEMIVEGRGYVRPSGPDGVKPIANFPPLYSYGLAFIHKFGFDAYPSARVLSGILFGSTLMAIGVGVLLATGSYVWSVYGMLLFLSSPVFIELYSYALSEPLYLFLSLSAFILLSFYLSRRRSLLLLIAVGILFGGVFLTRYIGISALIAGILTILANKSVPGREKRDFPIIIVGLLSVLPMLSFLLRNAVIAGDLTNRPAPYWHPPGLEQWVSARDAVLGWFMPPSWVQPLTPQTGWVIFVFLLTTLLVLMFLHIPKFARTGINVSFERIFLQIQSTYFVVYLILLLATVLLFDVLTPLNNRLLSPLLLTSLIIIVTILSRWWKRAGKQVRAVIVVLAVYLLGNHVYQTSSLIPYLVDTPQGYASSLYRSSPTIEYLRQMPNKIVYSNDLPALYFWADRDAIYIPSPSNPYARESFEDENYASALAEMRERMIYEDALLVILGSNPHERLDRAHWVDLTDGLTVIVEYADGIIFEY